MISFLVFLVVFGILIIVHEFGHFLVAKLQGVKVEQFSIGFGPALFKKTKNGTQYSISILPLGGYVKLAGDNLEERQGKNDEYFSKTPGERARIILCGPLLNYATGFLCFWFIFFAGFPVLTTKVGGLIDGYGAKDAGIQVGDRIISIDGKKLKSWDELQAAIYTRESSLAPKVVVLRQNKELTLEVKLKQKEVDDKIGSKRNVGLLGVSPEPSETFTEKYGFWQSLPLAAEKTWNLTILTYKAIWLLVTGSLSLRESVTGPIGIFYITSQAAHLGVIAVLNLVGLLSISLAIFNLLPLPVLDGGHILLLIIEKIRGRYISIKTERAISRIGFALIITLAVFVTYNDILRFKDQIFKFFVK